MRSKGLDLPYLPPPFRRRQTETPALCCTPARTCAVHAESKAGNHASFTWGEPGKVCLILDPGEGRALMGGVRGAEGREGREKRGGDRMGGEG
eukprot:3571695-Rhodomonas_salina.1